MSGFNGVLLPPEGPSEAEGPMIRCRAAFACISVLDRATVLIHGSRSTAELSALMKVEKAWYVGHRGLEIKDPQGRETRYYGPEDLRFVQTLSEELVRQTDYLAGVDVQPLGPSLRLDYRKADPLQIPELLERFRSVVSPFNPKLTLAHASGTIEVRIRCAFDEGMALRYVHRRLLPGTFLIYFGGDSAIHEGLRQLRPAGVIVHVGEKAAGSADFALPGPDEVVEVLERISVDWRKALEESTPSGA
jgi:trehalose-phosphatase